MIRVDTVTETRFTCDAPDCTESFISTWVPVVPAAHSHAEEHGWIAGPIKQLCPTHAALKAVDDKLIAEGYPADCVTWVCTDHHRHCTWLGRDHDQHECYWCTLNRRQSITTIDTV